MPAITPSERRERHIRQLFSLPQREGFDGSGTAFLAYSRTFISVIEELHQYRRELQISARGDHHGQPLPSGSYRGGKEAIKYKRKLPD